MTKGIDDALGLSSMPTVIDNNLPVVQSEPTEPQAVEEEIEDVRDNLHNAISLSQQAVQDMLSIAQQSQHPKAYEVLNSMIKTYADISMGLADLQMKKQRLVGSKPASQEPQTINNNLFVGSTAEMLKIIEDMKNNKERE